MEGGMRLIRIILQFNNILYIIISTNSWPQNDPKTRTAQREPPIRWAYWQYIVQLLSKKEKSL